MSAAPYSRFEGSDLILRDHLAIDRTVMANERTVLAYIRTAAILFGGAVTLIKFFPEQKLTQVFGAFFVLLSIGMLIVGWMRYTRQRRVLEELQKKGR